MANPLPQVTWTYNGGKLPVDPMRIKEETIIGMTSLVLAKVKRKDTGKYKVTLENEFGKADMTYNIKVLGKYIIFDFCLLVILSCLYAISYFFILILVGKKYWSRHN